MALVIHICDPAFRLKQFLVNESNRITLLGPKHFTLTFNDSCDLNVLVRSFQKLFDFAPLFSVRRQNNHIRLAHSCRVTVNKVFGNLNLQR